ncbi:MAG TPA: DUF3127 domain-containing protein [Prolixibacteraceae bacterium]|nr:DUF3127 domain-containing protein [Prolixibacteraceae bacterium]
MEVKGTITQILPSQSGVSKTGNEWSKQEFVIETEEQFPKKVCFTLFGDKVSLLKGLSTGDAVEVSFSVESREFNGKWYHNINAWRINPQQPQAPASHPDHSFDDDLPLPPPEPEREDMPYNDLPF